MASSFGDALTDLGKGMAKGVLSTTSGLGDIIHNVGEVIHPGLGEAVIPSSGLQAETGYSHPSYTAQKVGYGGETLMEFLLGDEAIKGLSFADKLSTAAGVAKTLQNSPRIMRALQIGADALRTGTVVGTQSAVRSGGDMGQAATDAALAAGTAGVVSGATGATVGGIKAVKSAAQSLAKSLDVQSVQEPLQQGIRDLLGSVEKSAGVTPTSAQSIRDVASNLSDALRAKASGIYQQLDAATGGRFQRFDEALENIRQELRDTVGLDDGKEADLLAKQDTTEKARQEALDKAAASGVDPKLIHTANQTWRQQAALSDLSNGIRQSTSGLRPEIANGAKATPETVNSKTLFAKVNRLYDKATPNGGNRLADAIGQENAQNLLRHVDSMYLEAQKIASRNKYAVMTAKAIGLGGAGSLGYEAIRGLHGLLGDSQ